MLCLTGAWRPPPGSQAQEGADLFAATLGAHLHRILVSHAKKQEKLRGKFAKQVMATMDKCSKTLLCIRDFDVTLFSKAAAEFAAESRQLALSFCHEMFGLDDKFAKVLYDSSRAAFESAISSVVDAKDKAQREQVTY